MRVDRSLRRLGRVMALVAFAAVFSVPGAAAAKSPGGRLSFGPDIVLPGGQGAEPSMALDTTATTNTETCNASEFSENGGTDRHHVPHFLPGQNTALTEWLKGEKCSTWAGRCAAGTRTSR